MYVRCTCGCVGGTYSVGPCCTGCWPPYTQWQPAGWQQQPDCTAARTVCLSVALVACNLSKDCAFLVHFYATSRSNGMKYSASYCPMTWLTISENAMKHGRGMSVFYWRGFTLIAQTSKICYINEHLYAYQLHLLFVIRLKTMLFWFIFMSRLIAVFRNILLVTLQWHGLRCSLLLRMYHGLCVLSVCWSRSWAVLKWLNQLRCYLGRGLGWVQVSMY